MQWSRIAYKIEIVEKNTTLCEQFNIAIETNKGKIDTTHFPELVHAL